MLEEQAAGGEGMRQTAQPLAQQSVDPGRRQAVADRLQALRIGTGLDAVVERLEGDALLGELLLGVLVAVQAELGVVWEVAAELQEERPEVAVDGLDVVVVHHGAGADDPRIAPAVRRVPLLGPEHRGLLLSLADEHHAFGALEAPQALGHHVVLALAGSELHHLDPVLSGATLPFRHEVQ